MDVIVLRAIKGYLSNGSYCRKDLKVGDWVWGGWILCLRLRLRLSFVGPDKDCE